MEFFRDTKTANKLTDEFCCNRIRLGIWKWKRLHPLRALVSHNKNPNMSTVTPGQWTQQVQGHPFNRGTLSVLLQRSF